MRSYFRKNFTNKLIEKFTSGIAFSLELLQENSKSQHKREIINVESLGKCCVLDGKDCQNVLEELDFVCKMCGVLLSRVQKLELKEILKLEHFSRVFKHKIAIEKAGKKLFICSYCPKVVMPKRVREQYRSLRIPPKFRIFLFQAKILGAEQKILDIIFHLRSKDE